MNLETATIVFLVAVFVAAEIWRVLRGQSGVIVSAHEDGLGFAMLGMGTVDVRLESGEQVSASVNCCTACLGRLQIGDQVRVTSSKEGYVVDLPWVRRRVCREDSGEEPGNPFLIEKECSPEPLPKNANDISHWCNSREVGCRRP